ncbi:stage V sporulation protein AC [Clostridium tagluense]|uniref:stage V sporulation protein AC n=1 Tax=Clostridium TaxID=1485 RepID=UPI0013E94C8E|nr:MULTISPECIES: stage V sporulation protein AC [Clostridium]MBW9159581.1 stage V sporulation protein AC [Clostridium tagluense]MBZ9623135.1 stage V sporulation protein AC [Clostridium sp. FP2]MCB2313957.1 stage V sporulation protein AC [Clostridium tagluense]MCB2319016.1 stage V sporulation protein AC [Clostridium tagluense]MCB2323668.1 stage V sporulation protein AC [Clostridium tagluense]
MSNMKKKKLTPTELRYDKLVKKIEPKRPILKNCIKAFLVGGAICTIGQCLQLFFITYLNFNEKTAVSPTSIVLIFMSALLTGLGVYDHLGQWAGAGSAVPVTGFANSIASAAIEHRSEGYVLGVAGNMFRLAGAIIVYGVFSAFVVATIKITIIWLGRM